MVSVRDISAEEAYEVALFDKFFYWAYIPGNFRQVKWVDGIHRNDLQDINEPVPGS